MYFVTMTDKFLSGWGKATGKIAKFVYTCDTYDEASIVVSNAEARGDQKNINIARTKPYYTPSRYYAQFKTKLDSPNWYTPGYFHK